MDQERFDRITRTLASRQSRRSLLKALTGTAVSGALAAVGIGGAVAAPKADKPSKCYGDNSLCTNAKQCCSGICTNRACAPAVPVDPCAGKHCDDANECTTDGCAGGVCAHTPTPGVPCQGGTGTCDSAGVCKPGVACGPGMSCPPPPSSCHSYTCDVATSICHIHVLPEGVSCDSGAGTCDGQGNCIYPTDPCANVTCPPTGNECIGTFCEQGQCFTKPAGPGVPCSNGICDGMGTCLPDPCANVTCPPTGNECIGTYCEQGQCFTKPTGPGAPCSNGICDGMGNCQPIGGTCIADGWPSDPMVPCCSNCQGSAPDVCLGCEN